LRERTKEKFVVISILYIQFEKTKKERTFPSSSGSSFTDLFVFNQFLPGAIPAADDDDDDEPFDKEPSPISFLKLPRPRFIVIVDRFVGAAPMREYAVVVVIVVHDV
jgi:hypothetical protein